jgi:hypothetical protein
MYQGSIYLTDFDDTAIRGPLCVTWPSYCPNCQGRVRLALPQGKIWDREAAAHVEASNAV